MTLLSLSLDVCLVNKSEWTNTSLSLIGIQTLSGSFFEGINQITLAIWESFNVQLVSSLSTVDLTNNENILLFVCSEAVESKLLKLATRDHYYKTIFAVIELS